LGSEYFFFSSFTKYQIQISKHSNYKVAVLFKGVKLGVHGGDTSTEVAGKLGAKENILTKKLEGSRPGGGGGGAECAHNEDLSISNT
jgi:hypothetical protein